MSWIDLLIVFGVSVVVTGLFLLPGEISRWRRRRQDDKEFTAFLRRLKRQDAAYMKAMENLLDAIKEDAILEAEVIE